LYLYPPDKPNRVPFSRGEPGTGFRTDSHLSKKAIRQKPKITAFVDGPIVPNAGLPPKEQAADLQTKVTETMKSRAKANTYTYINYIKLTP